MKNDKKDKNKYNEEESKQISVYMNSSALFELNNCLYHSADRFPWHIHAQGYKTERGGYSLIRAVMVDYSMKGNSFSVYANLSPEHVKYLFAQMQRGVKEFSFFQQKIVRNWDEEQDNAGIVTCFSISRNGTDASGEERQMPWQVEIQNGTGILVRDRHIGYYCQDGSYRKKKSVMINLKDDEIFSLFARADAVIRAFELDILLRRRNAGNLRNFYKMLEGHIPGSKEKDGMDKAA